MEHTSSKNIVLWVILVFIIILCTIGVTFAFFNYTRLSNNNVGLTTGKAVLGYVEEANGIFLSNALPISDVNALNTTNPDDYFDFYVTYELGSSASLDYEIDIENTTSNLEEIQNGSCTPLDSSRIKIALEDRSVTLPEEPMIVGATYFSEVEVNKATNGAAGYYLHSENVTGKGTHYYRLYMWIPEVDDLGVAIPLIDMNGVSGIQNQAFSVKINVQAVASVQ